MAKKSSSLPASYSTLDELVTRVLCDTAPDGSVDTAYLFGETKDNQESVLKAGALLYLTGPAEKIAICGLAEGSGYPGVLSWREKLISLAVPEEDILEVPPAPDFPPSTHAEALGLARFAKLHKWKSIYVIAPPLHQLRAFVTTVTEALKEYPEFLIYSFPGVPQNWEEHIVHSQGIQKGTRSELLAEELKKIEKYYKKGDLLSAEEILKYLNWRDKNQNF